MSSHAGDGHGSLLQILELLLLELDNTLRYMMREESYLEFTKIGSTPNLSSIGWKVWPREIHKDSARILKQDMNSNSDT
jgi:hypothetical protein